MQAIKRVRIGDCNNKDIIRLPEGIIAEIHLTPGMYNINIEGETITCYTINTNTRHMLKPDRYVDLINIKALSDRQYNPIEGNVFADFLEENGHIEAANLLRKEFPLLLNKIT